jgi:hypothetical protein
MSGALTSSAMIVQGQRAAARNSSVYGI